MDRAAEHERDGADVDHSVDLSRATEKRSCRLNLSQRVVKQLPAAVGPHVLQHRGSCFRV
jgi:hypothetical protein